MLDQIMENAGDEERPPMPEGGIPRQWLPGFIRWPIRVLVLPFVWLDIGCQWIAKQMIRPPFKKVGKCKRRGNCCHYILIRKSKGVFGFLDSFWHTQVNGFFKRDNKVYEHNNIKVHLMGCRYLKEDGTCSVYRMRPAICRAWPRIEYFGYPQILKGCGYKAVPRTPTGKKSSQAH